MSYVEKVAKFFIGLFLARSVDKCGRPNKNLYLLKIPNFEIFRLTHTALWGLIALISKQFHSLTLYRT